MCDVDIIGRAQLLLESNWVEGEGCKDWVKGRAKALPELLRKGVQGRSSIRWESKDFKGKGERVRPNLKESATHRLRGVSARIK